MGPFQSPPLPARKQGTAHRLNITPPVLRRRRSTADHDLPLRSCLSPRLRQSRARRVRAYVLPHFDGDLAQLVFPGWSNITRPVSRDFSGTWTRKLYTRSSATLFDWAIDYDNEGSVEATERDCNGNILAVPVSRQASGPLALSCAMH